MIKYSTIIHLRFPFSVFLLPIYLFALSQSPEVSYENAILIFIVLHLLVYPASNGYNSYFDKDEGSIGGIKTPPKVTRQLYLAALMMDAVGLIIAFFISWIFGTGILIYGLASKAYSHPFIRLKRYPVIGWLTIGTFQGFITYLISFQGMNDLPIQETISDGWQPAVLATVLLLGSYPMTQVYQHEEDEKRGDITISYKLGLLGTFHFTGILFGIATLCFFLFFLKNHSAITAALFLGCMLPTVIFFGVWYFQVRINPQKADYRNTMTLNLISSIGLSLFFLLITFFDM
jgi:1,4-dihydroxy-2-naphthoate octaprenyltransferase